MDKKLMIYPFNKCLDAVARYARLLKGYLLTAAVSPKNYGYEGKDISHVDRGDFTGITITSSFQEEFEHCDSILFSASTFYSDLNFNIKKIQESVKAGKEVMITKELAGDFIYEQINIPASVKVLGNNPYGQKISYEKIKHVREINVPVLTIFNVGEFCHGFDTQLLMAERFEKEGYRVSMVSSNSLGELFGMHLLPDYIYDSHMSYEDKIVSMNHFLISLTEKEQPDILLLQAEEAILPFNDRITKHFGVIPSIIAKAVLADVSILNIYYNIYNKEYLDHLKYYCQYALNAEIHSINIANTTMQIKEIDSTEPVHYVTVDKHKVLHAIESDYKNYDCIFFQTYDTNSVDSVFYSIVDKLSQNEEIVRIW